MGWFRKKEKIEYPTADAWQYENSPWVDPNTNQSPVHQQHTQQWDGDTSFSTQYNSSQKNSESITDWDDEQKKTFSLRHYAVLIWAFLLLYALFVTLGYFTSDFQSGKGVIITPKEREIRHYLHQVHNTMITLRGFEDQLEQYRGKNGEWIKNYNGILNQLVQMRELLINTPMPDEMILLHQKLLAIGITSDQPAAMFSKGDLLSTAYQTLEAFKLDFNEQNPEHYINKGYAFMIVWNDLEKDVNDLEIQYGIEEEIPLSQW